MAAIVWSTDVIGSFPNDAALAAVPVALQTMILNHVNTRVAVDIFDGEDGNDTKLARCLLAAHMATQPTAIPFVTAETEGGISRQYAAREGLEETGYGSLYSRMCRLNAGGGWVA